MVSVGLGAEGSCVTEEAPGAYHIGHGEPMEDF